MKQNKWAVLTACMLTIICISCISFCLVLASGITLKKIQLSSSTINIVGLNTEYTEFHVSAVYSDGSIQDVTNSCTFSTNNQNIAYVTENTSGNKIIKTGSSVGTAKITVTYLSKKVTCNVKVSPALSYITIAPNELTITGPNKKANKVVVNAVYEDGSQKAVTTSASYYSTNSDIAYVASYYITSGTNSGRATISATYQGKTAACNVTVNSVLTKLMISPLESTISAKNTAGGLVAVTGVYSDGTSRDLTGFCTYTTSDSGIACLKDGYLRSGTKAGTATITAKYSNISCTCKVNVILIPSYIKISPTTDTISGTGVTSKKVAVTAYFPDGTKQTITNLANYTSNDSNIAYINNYYINSGTKTGTAIITATYGGVSAAITVKVNANILPSKQIVRNKLVKEHGQVSNINSSIQTTQYMNLNSAEKSFNVIAQFADGYVLDISSKTMFNTSNGDIAYIKRDIDGNKFIKVGNKKGTAKITAIFGGKIVSFDVVVQ